MAKVLVIEDTPDNMALISFILRRNGYEIVEAETGEQGVELALSESGLEFVILDIQLPDFDGTEVLRRIRAGESGRPVPVIAMTSYAMSGDKERLLAAGCNGYVEKPIDPIRVMDEIREVLAQTRAG